VLNAYGKSATEAGDVSDTLFQTVNLGVTTFEALAHNVGDYLGQAHALGASFAETQSAIATLTLTGTTQMQAGTALGAVLNQLIRPQQGLADALHNMGQESGTAAIQTLGLRGTLEGLAQQSGGSAEAMGQLFTDTQALRAALQLTSNGGAKYAEVAGQIEDKTARAGAAQGALAEQSKSAAYQLTILKNQASALAMEAIRGGLPLLVQGIDDVRSSAKQTGEVLGPVFADVAPIFEDLWHATVNLAEATGEVASAFAPVAEALAAIVGIPVVAALRIIASGLESVTGVLAGNSDAAVAFAIALTAVLTPALLRTAGVIAGELLVSLYRLYIMLPTLLPLIATTAAAMAPFLVAGAAIFGVYKFFDSIGDAADSAKQKVDGFTSGITDQSTFADIDTARGKILDLIHTQEQAANRSKAGGFGGGWKDALDAATGGLWRHQAAADAAKKKLDEFDEAQRNGARNVDVMTHATSLSATEVRELAKAHGVDLLGAVEDVYPKLLAAVAEEDRHRVVIGGVTGALKSEAEAQKQATQALQDHADAVRALTDPIFAMQQALSAQKGAVQDVAKAIKEHGRNSQEAEDALFGLARANVDVTTAADKMSAAMQDGGLGAREMSGLLRQWVTQGKLTQAQADALAGKINKLNTEAGRLSGTKVDVKVTANTQPAVKGLGDVGHKAQEAALPRKIDLSLPSTFPALTAKLDGTLHKLDIIDRTEWQADVTIGVNGINTLDGALAKLDRLDRQQDAVGTPSDRPASVTRKAAGGLLSGPGTGTSDSIPVLASNGEFIVNAKATEANLPLLESINRRRYATGGQVGGPPAPAKAHRPSKAAGAPTAQEAKAAADRIAANRAEWAFDQLATDAQIANLTRRLKATKQYTDEWMGMARQRQQLIEQQQSDKAHQQQNRADWIFDHSSAQSQLNDIDRRLAKEKRYSDVWVTLMDKRGQVVQALADKQDAADKDAADRAADAIRMQDNEYEVGVRSAAQQIASLDERMNHEVQYSDAWMALYRQRQQVLDDVAAAEKKAADDTQAAVDKMTGALDTLNGLLDDEQRTRDQMSASDQKWAKAQTRLHDEEVKAVVDFYDKLAAAADEYAKAEQQILQARQAGLLGWASISERSSMTWGNTLDQLQGNVTDQIDTFREWMDRLQEARSRGVSEQVISALGLDEGPKALGQLRQFSKATVAQIQSLNDVVASRVALGAEEVRREQAGSLGKLGEDLADAQQQYTASVLSIQQQYRVEQERIASDLDQAQQDWKDEQAQLAKDLAAIGVDQGRSYGDALAAGLTSALPGVVAAATALAAAAAAVPSLPSTATAATAQPQVVQAPAQQLDTNIRGTGPRPVEREYDGGGWLDPGYTLAYNGTGQRERVLTNEQYAGAAQPMSVRVFIGDRELTDIVDVRIDSTLGDRAGRATVAGSR
jgi:hypothetical protein